MKSFLVMVVVLSGLTSASALRAASLAPPCGPDTLSAYELFNADGQCSVGVLDFLDFTFAASGTGDANLLDSSQIEVTPVANGNLGGGFSFSPINPAAFAVGPGQTATYFIDWFFVIDPGPGGASADLSMDPPFGNVSITQSYCADGSTVGRDFCSTGFQSLTVSTPPCTDPVNHPEQCTAFLAFDPPIQNFAEEETTIVLTGGETGAGFDSMTGTVGVVETTATPEPASLFLGLGALLVIASRVRVRTV